ncbi:MAG: helix-turn-helix domain-containing protein [Prevotella histicola]|uniref:helix-turn-helix domain-containing protein n=1 Tax=Prevotella histicola TaxID=470565 RepID=UPI001CAB7CE4|nr:helix-turn-helix domain-containing protein [Prevotella histicola]MBF1393919.1 helix-turn-helix domain-containing protein [Prevotella histicola]DAX66364.1 MAG TPA: helix-turn-helix domain protein [Caudoviricetes sp.]
MVTEQPSVKPTGRYSVNDTCKLLGIHRNTLLNHTKAGHIQAMRRKATKSKFFLGKDITKFWYQMV